MLIARLLADMTRKEIENRAREFYELVPPPVDMHLDGDSLTVVIDMPGFTKEEIQLTLRRNLLIVKASRSASESSGRTICRQRPDAISRIIRLPVHIREGDEGARSARYADGVLTVLIGIPKRGQDIAIE